LQPQKRINRPKFYYESGRVQSSSVVYPLRVESIAYSDTAAVTS